MRTKIHKRTRGEKHEEKEDFEKSKRGEQVTNDDDGRAHRDVHIRDDEDRDEMAKWEGYH